MNIEVTPLFESQYRAILEQMAQKSLQEAKSFKIYLDTILINIPTKAKKYKTSELFTPKQSVQLIEHQGYTIPFYYDADQDSYIILGIF